MPQLHLVMRGRVQGVGMRYFVLRAALRLHVRGWVRNLPGGEVEIEAEGPRPALVELAEAVRHGPPASEILGCDEAWRDAESGHRGFRIVG